MVRQGNRVVIPFRAILKWLVRLRRSPRAIAGGFALGTFIAMTPTFGIQLGIAILLATFMNVTRPAAMLAVWVSNVATIAPIYTFNYGVGKMFCGGPDVKVVYATFLDVAAKLVKFEIWEMFDQFEVVMGLGREIVIPLVVGSILVGLVCGFIAYLLSMVLLQIVLVYYRRRKGLPPNTP